jgi:hypothetical protein
MERERSVKIDAKNGGDQCTETTESRSCNAGACDKDCVLAEWTEWSDCSKECNGGFRKRIKDIAEPAVGDGKCPKLGVTGENLFGKREQNLPCNTQACMKKSEFLHCKAKLDVVLLLDGSGSLGASGWAATKKAGKMLAEAFGGDQQLAVLLFSGPKYWSGVRKCVGSNQAGVDMSKDCGITWVQHFDETVKAAAIVAKIDGLSWPKGGTLTSVALRTAAAELPLGRSDADSIVIVVTDGRPLFYRATGIAAKAVRTKARLLFVPVTRFAPLKYIRGWASWPPKDNIVKIDNFANLADPSTIDTIISDSCKELE